MYVGFCPHRDRDVIGGVAAGGAVLDALEQDGQRAPDPSRRDSAPARRRPARAFPGRGRPLPPRPPAASAPPACRRGGRTGNTCTLAKPVRLRTRQEAAKSASVSPGEADDDVGGDGAVRKSRVQALRLTPVFRRGIAAGAWRRASCRTRSGARCGSAGTASETRKGDPGAPA